MGGVTAVTVQFSEIHGGQKISYLGEYGEWIETVVETADKYGSPPYLLLDDGTLLDWGARGVGTGWTIYYRNGPHGASDLLLGWVSHHKLQAELGHDPAVLEWIEGVV